MMDEVSNEEGTIPKGHFAIVVAPDGDVSMYVPKTDEEMPEPFLAATMIGVKLMREPEWVQALIDEFIGNVDRHQQSGRPN